MEIQWPLLIFSVLLGVTSGSFVFLAVGELRGKFREVRFTGALIAFICLAVGGCVSVLHMGHPERATHLLGNLGSGLSKELFVVAIMGIVALVYLILAKKDYPGVSKVFGILGGVIGLVLPFVAGASYLIAARPAWDSVALPLMFLGAGLALGMTLMAGLVLLRGKASEEGGFALKLALAGVVIMAVTALICTLGLALLGNPYSVLLGLGIGLLDALPVFGTGAVLLPWGAFLLLKRQWWKGAVLLSVYGLCYFLRQFLEAKLMGNRMGLSALETLVSMYVGLELFGVSGFFLGPVGLLIIEDLVKLYGEDGESR